MLQLTERPLGVGAGRRPFWATPPWVFVLCSLAALPRRRRPSWVLPCHAPRLPQGGAPGGQWNLGSAQVFSSCPLTDFHAPNCEISLLQCWGLR